MSAKANVEAVFIIRYLLSTYKFSKFYVDVSINIMLNLTFLDVQFGEMVLGYANAEEVLNTYLISTYRIYQQLMFTIPSPNLNKIKSSSWIHRANWYINCKINVIRLLEEHFLLISSFLRSFDLLIFSRAIKIYLLTLRLHSHSPARSPAIYLALSPSSGYINCRVVEHSKRLSLGMSDTFENVLHLFGSDLHTTYVYIYKGTYVKPYAKTAAATTTTTTTSTGR